MDKDILQEQADNEIENNSIDPESPTGKDEDVLDHQLDDMFAQGDNENDEDGDEIDKKTRTKAFSKRLKEEKEKIKKEISREERNNIAKTLGYDNYEQLSNSLIDKELIDKGYEPEDIKPFLEKIVKQHPEYKKLQEFKEEQERKEAERWSNDQLNNLNNKYGTDFKSIDDLDEETIRLFNNGVALDKAFAVNNYEYVEKQAYKKLKRNGGKDHLKEVGGNSPSTKAIPKANNDDLKLFKRFNPDATEEEINDFIKRNRK